MRQLQAGDLFNFSKLLSKMNIKSEIKKILSSDDKSDKGEDKKNTDEKSTDANSTNVFVGAGFDVVMLILENLPKAEEEFYGFVGPILDKTNDEIKIMPINELIQALTAIWSNIDFASFFK